MVKVNKVTHLLRQVAPFLREHHHVLAALAVIVFCRDITRTLMVINISLGNAQFLLHAQLYGQTVGVPSCLAVHLITLHGLITIEGILDGTGKYMMNARVTVGRGRTFEEYELWTSLTLCDGAVEDIFLIPCIEYALVGLSQIQAMMFGEFLCHNLTLFIIVLFFRAQRYIKNSYPQRIYHLLI